jgi:membrane protease YdiL (CAAX protease family)
MNGAAAPARSPSQSPNDRFADALRGFGPLGILAILVILAPALVSVPLSGLLVLVWASRSHTPWREIGYVRPKSWVGSLAVGIVFGVAFKLVMKIIVMPLLGADPINHAYHYLAGNPAALPGIMFAFITSAGFGEETVFRGYLFERLGRLFGSGWIAKTSIVLLTAGLFALAHYSVQGLAGSEQAMITGTVFGAIFAVTGRLWMLMCAHVAFDLAALAIIYWDLESAVAHLVFK